MKYNILTIWDLLLTPLFLYVIVSLAKKYRDKHFPEGHIYHKNFLRGLYLKLGGAIFIGLVYAYYYDGGDTFMYHLHARIINSADSIGTWFQLMRQVSPDQDPKLYEYSSQMQWYREASTYTVARIAALFGLINATSYMPIALLFAVVSFSGIWAMYTTFVNIYPKLYKELAIAFLFVPSTVVWGSSIYKDTICMFSLGWITYCMFRIFFNRDFSPKNLAILLVCIYLIAIIKIYILMALLPALTLWLLLTYSKKIKTVFARWIVNLGAVAVLAFGFTFVMRAFAAQLKEYSLENIIAKSKKTQSYILYMSELQEGSGYDLGDYEPTPAGILSKLPAAVNVTLYRPYIWESRKLIQLLSAIEATIFLIATIYILYRRGPKKFFFSIFTDPNLLFFFIFTVVFAFAVGISTGNFGSLSRYKIPCMPFFAALLLVIYKKQEKRIFSNTEAQ